MTEYVTIQRVVGSNTHTFTFSGGMIHNISDNLTTEPNITESPGSGPGQNTGASFGGVKQTITLTGELIDEDTSVVSGTSAPTITTKEQMKYWLQSLFTGSDLARTFTGPTNDYVLSVDTSTTTIEGVAIPGTWVATKVYVVSLTFDTEHDNPAGIPFTFTLEVALV